MNTGLLNMSEMKASPLLWPTVSLDYLSFYPSNKYLAKNWKPEEMARYSLRNLAKAQKIATQQGLLSPKLANSMLPIAMVEGWDGGYGVVDSKYGYPATPERDAILSKLGLRIGYSDSPPQNYKEIDVLRDTKEGYYIPSGKWKDDPKRAQEAHALLVPAILAEKARLYGEDMAIERWNGKGRAIEDDGYSTAFADSKNHVRKVQEAMNMLNHPKNAGLLNAYRSYLNQE